MALLAAAALLLACAWTSEAFLLPATSPQQQRQQRPTTVVGHPRRPSLAARRAAAAAGEADGGSSSVPPPPFAMPTERGDGGFVVEGPLSERKDRFIVDITVAEPTAAELAEENVVKIVKQQCTDEEVNMLAWKCLGACGGS